MSKPHIYRYKDLPSTNTEIKRLQLIKRLPEFSTVIASNQTAGKGLLNNSWESEKDKNLTFSIIFYPTFILPQDFFIITFIVSTALVKILKKYISDVTIKWTNDIYAGDKKIAGILIENTIIGEQFDYSIVGIGLNVNQIKFVSNAPNPVSMKQLTENEFNIDNLFQEFSNSLINEYLQCAKDGFNNVRNNYLSLLYRKMGLFAYKDDGGLFSAKIETVENSGHLVLLDANENRRRYSFNQLKFVF